MLRVRKPWNNTSEPWQHWGKLGLQSHYLHFQWKFKLLAGKFTWGNKAKHCWVISTNFLLSRVCWQCQQCFAFRGHSVTTRTEFCHFLVFILWAWTKTDIFDPLPPPHLVHVVIECPLTPQANFPAHILKFLLFYLCIHNYLRFLFFIGTELHYL